MSIAWFWGLVLPFITLSGWVLCGKLNLKPTADAKLYPWLVQLAIQVPWWASCIMIGDWFRSLNTGLFTLYFVVMVALIMRAKARVVVQVEHVPVRVCADDCSICIFHRRCERAA